MAQHWLNVDTDPRTDEEILALFERHRFSGWGELYVEDDDGTRVIRLRRTGSNHNYCAALFLPAGVVSDAQVYVYGRIEFTAPVRETGIAARIDSSQPSSTFYGSLQLGTSGRAICKLVNENTASEKLATSSFGVTTAETYHSSLLDVSGTTIRHKAWDGVRADEPADWLDTVTDTDIASGYTGLWMKGGASTPSIRVVILAIGTDGDPAPTGPVGPGGSSRRRSPLLLVPR